MQDVRERKSTFSKEGEAQADDEQGKQENEQAFLPGKFARCGKKNGDCSEQGQVGGSCAPKKNRKGRWDEERLSDNECGQRAQFFQKFSPKPQGRDEREQNITAHPIPGHGACQATGQERVVVDDIVACDILMEAGKALEVGSC